MRKNVLLKSLCRQPLRAVLMGALILLAAFVFVLRIVENQVVREQIRQISEYYRVAGHVAHPELFGDVSEAVQLIADSEEIAFLDRRRAAQGFLADMLNANITGMNPLLTYDSDFRDREIQHTEVYALITVDTMAMTGRSQMIDDEMVYFDIRYTVEVTVDEVLFGQREHIERSQRMTFAFLEENHPYSEMEMGESYLIRAAYLQQYQPPIRTPSRFDPIAGPWVPTAGRPFSNDPLTPWPLHEDTELYYYPVPPGSRPDFSVPELAHIPAEIERLDRNNRQIFLQTTTDMSAMHIAQSAIELMHGRLLTYDDYQNAHPVAVIDANFAGSRGLSLADTFTVRVPMHQVYTDRALQAPDFFVPLVLAADDDPSAAYEMELTVVGITRFARFRREREQSLFVFIPDSVLPADMHIEMPDADYLPAAWFSFQLHATRDQDGFYNDYGEAVRMLGMELVVTYEDSGNFWASADPILLVMTFNTILFGALAALVLGLVCYLFIRFRAREMAILRALGRSGKGVFAYLLATALLLAVPAVAAGSAGAWFFGQFQAERTLVRLTDVYEEARPPTDFELQWETVFDRPVPETWTGGRAWDYTVEMDIQWLWILSAMIFGVLLCMFVVGGIRALRRPVLGLLQGSAWMWREAPVPVAVTATAEPVAVPEIDLQAVTEAIPATEKTWPSYFRWAARHISRAPLKTALGFSVTLFFALALGWLQSAAHNTRTEIDHLYDSTYIKGHFVGTLNRHLFSQAVNTGYLHSYSVIAMRNNGQIIGPQDGVLPTDGFVEAAPMPTEAFIAETLADLLDEFSEMPEEFDWMPTIEAIWRQHQNNTILGISDVDAFIQDVGHTWGGITHIEYAPGFDAQLFAMREYHAVPPNEPLPAIVPASLLEKYGVGPGDTLLLAANLFGMAGSVDYRPIIVAGVHDGRMHWLSNWPDVVVMPYWAMSGFFKGTQWYSAMDFVIDPAFNRNLREVALALRVAVNPQHQSGGVQSEIDDGELRSVITAMDQILLMMTLFYRVVLVLALGIGGGLALLLVLQHAKNAAVFRVLGTGRRDIQLTLCAEQLLICAAGVALGIIVLLIVGSHPGSVFIAAGLYLAGAGIGMTIGSAIVTRKAPMEMLQVRE